VDAKLKNSNKKPPTGGFLVSEQYGYTVGVALSLLTQQVHDFLWSMISQIADKPTKM
jgi:hypothetical protein